MDCRDIGHMEYPASDSVTKSESLDCKSPDGAVEGKEPNPGMDAAALVGISGSPVLS